MRKVTSYKEDTTSESSEGEEDFADGLDFNHEETDPLETVEAGEDPNTEAVELVVAVADPKTDPLEAVEAGADLKTDPPTIVAWAVLAPKTDPL